MNELAGKSLGGYRLEEEIGRGSMGMVYRGKQIALEREVAIKVLPQGLAQDAAYVARFIREARIIAGLNHPNIVQIYDAGRQDEFLYFTMEYIQGPTIGSLLQIDQQIPQHLAAEYAAQIADALDSAYQERNVIHRDIKPENLMLDRWGKIKVMDFGLARAIGLQRITVAKTLVGSIHYSSPEQLWGETLDNRSDIYALGVVLYEMVCGHRPFNSRSLPELTQSIIQGALTPPSQIYPEIDRELEHIILTALALDRNHRYPHARMMAQALRALDLTRYQPQQIATRTRSAAHISVLPPKRPVAQPLPAMNFNLPEHAYLRPRPEQATTETLRPIYEYETSLHPQVQPANLAHMQAPRPAMDNVICELPSRSRFWQQIQRLFKTPRIAIDSDSPIVQNRE